MILILHCLVQLLTSTVYFQNNAYAAAAEITVRKSQCDHSLQSNVEVASQELLEKMYSSSTFAMAMFDALDDYCSPSMFNLDGDVIKFSGFFANPKDIESLPPYLFFLVKEGDRNERLVAVNIRLEGQRFIAVPLDEPKIAKVHAGHHLRELYEKHHERFLKELPAYNIIITVRILLASSADVNSEDYLKQERYWRALGLSVHREGHLLSVMGDMKRIGIVSFSDKIESIELVSSGTSH